MIHAPQPLGSGGAGGRLLQALARRGHPVAGGAVAPGESGTAFLCPAPGEDVAPLRSWIESLRPGPSLRLLVVTCLGAHPDARSASLRDCWMLEETARARAAPLLVLRLGPLLGPRSPLWRHLRAGARPGRRSDLLLNPVAESDVVETLDRALSQRAEWRGWFEVVGPEVWSLGELAALARGGGRAAGGDGGFWEPPLEELDEHRLAEAAPWLGHFGVSVRPLAVQAQAWRAAEEGSTA